MSDIPLEANSSDWFNYQNLQNILDRVIGKLGLKKTIKLLENFMGNSSIPPSQSERIKLITVYITSQCISIFDLKDEDFYTSKIREYREGRMACYHLLKKYTDCSYAKIGENFGQAKRNVMYYHNKCEEMLSMPRIYEVFYNQYNELENRIIQFISSLK